MKKEQIDVLHLILIYNVDFSMPIGSDQTDIQLTVPFVPRLNQITDFKINCFKQNGKTSFSCIIYNKDKYIQEIFVELKADLKTAVKVTQKDYMMPRGFRVGYITCNQTTMVVSGQKYSNTMLFFYDLDRESLEGDHFPKFAYDVREMFNANEDISAEKLRFQFSGANLIVSTGIKSEGANEYLYRVFNVDEYRIKLRCMDASCINSYQLRYEDITLDFSRIKQLQDILPAQTDYQNESQRIKINIWLFFAGTLPFMMLALKFYITQMRRDAKSLKLMRLGIDDMEDSEIDIVNTAAGGSRTATNEFNPVFYHSMAFTEEDE